MNSKKDWTGTSKSVYTVNGDSNHSNSIREENDFYATPASAVEQLIAMENFNQYILEPACGMGHISDILIKHGYDVCSEDLIDRGYGTANRDFLARNEKFEGDVITNPPYKYALEFVEKSLDIVNDSAKVAMFLKLTFLEGKKRRAFFDKNPPYKIYVASNRFECGKNGVFSGGSAIAYAWFIWKKGFNGNTTLKWFN